MRLESQIDKAIGELQERQAKTLMNSEEYIRLGAIIDALFWALYEDFTDVFLK